ncbi:hypothetical protein ACGFZ7_16360 [Pseudomonas sp. NPDC047963]|uniref:hypothetical protein n=1 Tax=uncultured Stutzerimonas sp. TaxID=2901168 RepID=UPI0032B2615C|nr:hypothetical protein [Pseudomonas sp.]|tara:strand:+ start:683 stop:1006 length:324 start_codon:yes stop_codon:yes gene_type:complete
MLKDELRHTHFPYCLDRQEDGSYVMLNRNYKPIGFMTGEWVNYEEHPVSVKLQGITQKLAAELDARGRENMERIHLYNDGCVPTDNAESMQAYLSRLSKLMALRIAG